MHNPLVSIIIPTFNRAHLIGETLDSVLMQTYINWECIVVDDGSTDDTEIVVMDYVKKDARFHYHQRPNSKPKGANACRNYGFEISNGEYVNWFDDDDVMLANFLEVKINVLNHNVDFVIVSGYFVDSNLERDSEIEIFQTSELFKDYVKWNIKVLTPSVLFKRAFLFKKELFLTKIKRGQETELFSRLFFQVKSSQYMIIEEYVFLYRQHEMTKTVKNKSYINEYVESQTYIAVENFKKSFKINDLELINHYYLLLLNIFFKGLENKHFSNSRLILVELLNILKSKNIKLVMELFILGHLLLILKKRSYSIEKKLKRFKIQ